MVSDLVSDLLSDLVSDLLSDLVSDLAPVSDDIAKGLDRADKRRMVGYKLTKKADKTIKTHEIDATSKGIIQTHRAARLIWG
ncbi:MAG: hypothetical protein ISQ21_06560 [Alphaproteobacteria bacterium]|nr:hypothetical protein [Alphaproteobacteria bacterium]